MLEPLLDFGGPHLECAAVEDPQVLCTAQRTSSTGIRELKEAQGTFANRRLETRFREMGEGSLAGYAPEVTQSPKDISGRDNPPSNTQGFSESLAVAGAGCRSLPSTNTNLGQWLPVKRGKPRDPMRPHSPEATHVLWRGGRALRDDSHVLLAFGPLLPNAQSMMAPSVASLRHAASSRDSLFCADSDPCSPAAAIVLEPSCRCCCCCSCCFALFCCCCARMKRDCTEVGLMRRRPLAVPRRKSSAICTPRMRRDQEQRKEENKDSIPESIAGKTSSLSYLLLARNIPLNGRWGHSSGSSGMSTSPRARHSASFIRRRP